MKRRFALEAGEPEVLSQVSLIRLSHAIGKLLVDILYADLRSLLQIILTKL
jgi:hypothetical protein